MLPDLMQGFEWRLEMCEECFVYIFFFLAHLIFENFCNIIRSSVFQTTVYHFVNALEAKEKQNQYGIKIIEAQHNNIKSISD